LSNTDTCKRELPITIPLDDVAAENTKVVAEFARQARLPGFRPGKAPLSIIRTRFGSDIRQKVLENLIPKALNERFRQDNLNVVGQPAVKDLHFHDGQPIEFKVEFEIAPNFELGEYVGIEAPYSQAQVSDAEVQDRLEKLRESKAEFVNEEPRPAREGDFAVIALESIEGAEPPVKKDEMTVKIGDPETMPEFSRNLLGTAPDETKEFSVDYPEDYAEPKLAGNTVRFSMRLKQLRRQELPDLNDEFAKDLGDFQTLDEVRDAIRGTILREKETAAQEAAKSAIIDKLVDAHVFPVPEAYVERQIEVQTENYLRTLAMQGHDIKNIQLDWEKIRSSQRDKAVRDVRASLILEKVADREAIGATQDDIDKEVQKLSRIEREAPAAVRMRLERDGGLGRLASRIRTEKTLNFLFDKSRKVAA
jgi:trigger factor